MTGTRFTKEREDEGKRYEALLKPFLEALHGQSLEATGLKYTFDYQNPNLLIELKTRDPHYHYDHPTILKKGWLVPYCKILKAAADTRRTFFYYFWKKDLSLWCLEYTPTAVEGLQPYIPFRHSSNQPHISIPQNRWKKVGVFNQEMTTLT